MTIKKILPASFCLLLSFSCFAQRKHGFAIGIDYIKNSRPKEWKGKNLETSFTPNALFHDINGDCGIWFAYYYKNLYSVKIGINSYSLSARADYYQNTTEGIILERQVQIYEALIGYNFSKTYFKLTESKLLKKLDSWLYLGAAHMGNNTFQTRFKYAVVTDSDSYDNKIRPVAQAMIKYNPIRYFFLGIGGTYRYIAKDFQPLSLNISAGLQL